MLEEKSRDFVFTAQCGVNIAYGVNSYGVKKIGIRRGKKNKMGE